MNCRQERITVFVFLLIDGEVDKNVKGYSCRGILIGWAGGFVQCMHTLEPCQECGMSHRRPREAVVSIMKEHLNGMISEFENNIVDIAYTCVPASSRIPFKADNSIGGTITADSRRIDLKSETIAAMLLWHHVICHQHQTSNS